MKSILLPPGKAHSVLLVVVTFLLGLAPRAVQASDITRQGLFTHDDDVQLFNLTVAMAGAVDIRSYGYAGGTASTGTVVPRGGFDTILTLFEGSGTFLKDNDDGAAVAADPQTGKAGDARITFNLAAGTYVVALTQFDNFSIGNLADGFAEAGNPNFTADPGFTAGAPCPGNLFRDISGTAGRCRDGNWTVDFVNVASVNTVAPVPEPGAGALLSTGLFGIILMLWKKRCTLARIGRQRMLLAALLAAVFSLGAPAQGPDYSNVHDFLDGRRTLLAIDDLVVSGVDSAGHIYTSTSTTTNSQLNPASTSSVCCQQNSVIKTLSGHMFNLPSSTTVELVAEPKKTGSEILLPFIGKTGTGINSAAGLIGGAMADFNGDGYDDLVLFFTGGRIQVATASDVNDPEQPPHLHFGPPNTLDTLVDMTVGDFNGDGRPEIAGLMQVSGGVLLVIYTVDPKTLVVSKASQITQNEDTISSENLSITKGRFTSAAHDQIVVAYSEVGVTHLELLDFAPPSLTPQEKTFTGFYGQLGPWGDGVMKVKTGKFGLPANPYDQVVFMFAIDGRPNYAHKSKYLLVLSIDPTTLAWTQNPLWDMEDLDCVFDVSIGNFDNLEPDPTKSGQTQHNFNDQISVLYSRRPDSSKGSAVDGSCNSGPRDLAILNADPNKFSMSLAASAKLPPLLNGLIPLSFTESDTQGRSMILGEPTKITLSTAVQPSVVIGVPPMHVDFISLNPAGGAPPQVINLSAVPDGYKTTYDQEDSTNNKSGSTNTTSWSFGTKESVGASITVGDPDEGNGLKTSDTLKSAQKLKGAAEHDHGTSQRKAFNLSATTGFGDEVTYLDPEFNIWVYPVIGKTVCPAAKPHCQYAERVPLTIQFSAPNGDTLTHATQGQALQWYQPPWEPGNIFSYPANLQQLRQIYPNLTLLTNEVEFLTDTSTVTEKTSWSVTQKDTATTSLDQNYSFENDFSSTGAVGVEGILTAGASYGLDLSGSTGLSSLNKQTTDLAASTGVQVSKPGTFATPQDYGYEVAPYLMGTTKPGGYVDSQPLSTDVQTFGLLRAMFTADSRTSDSGGWWIQAYSQAPDVALNHPSRWQISTPALTNPIPRNCLATGTGASQMDCAELSPRLPTNPWLSIFHQMRGFFISSALSPGQGPQLELATAGDVLTLQARVYNYSLAAMPAESQVHVRFYFMPWNPNKAVPAGDSVLIGEEELSPIPPFSDAPDAPYDWVLASTTFDTSKYEQTKNGPAYIAFWVVVWVEQRDGTLMHEMPAHGLTTIPGTLKSLADVSEEGYGNNLGFYKQVFYIAPPAGFVDSAPPAAAASIEISKVDLSADRINPHQTIVVSASLAAIDADASGVSANFYDGDPRNGGRLFDVERIPHIAQADPHLVQASYRFNTCGTHELFVVVNEGKSSEVTRRSHPVRVDCGSSK